MATGINLQAEFKQLVVDEQLGGWTHVRKVYRDSRGLPVKCRCTMSGTEPSSDCAHCYGTGHLWVEHPAFLYSTYFGNSKDEVALRIANINQTAKRWFAISDYKIGTGDYIISVDLNSDGTIKIPIVRLQYYNVTSVERYSETKGLTTYWKLFSNETTISEIRAPNKS